MLNKDSVKKLIEIKKNDRESLDLIRLCLDSFEQYHKAVFEDQTFPMIYGGGAIDGEEYREGRTASDRTRTLMHNGIISNVRILNRMAENAGIDPVYDGTVSEDKPYRREVANAVFEFLEDVINNRS